MPHSIYDRSLQESTLFELFKSESYTDTVKSLKLAQAQIVAKLLTVKDGTWTKRRLKSMQALINKEIAASYSGTLGILQSELPGIAEITAKNVLLTRFDKVPTKVISKITSGTLNVQGYDVSELFKTISDNHARQLRVIIGAGVAQGKSSKTIARQLQTKNAKLSKANLKNAIFTTVTEARAATRHESYKQLEKTGVITGYQYVATLDGRTTEYCRDHDNRIYRKPIEEIQSEINTHFHCRSVFAPLTKSSSASTRASQFGEVIDESYGEWFKKQSDPFQKSVLGKKKFEAYKAGSYKIGGLPDVVGKTMDLAAISSALPISTKEAMTLEGSLQDAEGLAYHSGQDNQMIISTDAYLKAPKDFELAYDISNTFHNDYFEDFVEKTVDLGSLIHTQDKVFFEVVKDKLINKADRLLPAIVDYEGDLYIVNGHHRIAARYFEGLDKTKVRIYKFTRSDIS